MKISQKLTFGFMGIASLIGIAGYILIGISQKNLQRVIGEHSIILAEETSDKIDRSIYSAVEQLQIYAESIPKKKIFINSNLEFDNNPDIRDFIAGVDKDWKEGKDTPFIQSLLNNELSRELKEKIQLERFYKNRYGYSVFPEAYVTNKYGVVIASTGRTSDYLQADEEWYQKAIREKAFWVGEVEYDESSDSYASDIVVNLYDENGNFSGIFKTVFNIEEVMGIIREIRIKEGEKIIQRRVIKHKRPEPLELKLLSKEGKVIYSSEKEKKEEFEVLGEVFGRLPSIVSGLSGEAGHSGYFIASGDEPGEAEELFAYNRSNGYRDFKGLGWIVVVEHKTGEIFAPVMKLRNTLIVISAVILIFALLIGFVISCSIAIPIIKIKNAVAEIGNGKIDKKIQIKSKDEIGSLADTINKMAADLKKTTTSVDNLNKEIAERKKAEEQMRKLSSAVAQSADPVLITNKDAVIEYVNPSWEKLTGYTEEEAIGKKPNILKSGKQDKAFYERLWQTILSGEPFHSVLVNKNKTGKLYYTEETITPIKDGMGHITHFVSNDKDITDRIRMEHGYKRLASFPELNPDPIVEIDLAGRISYTNPVARKLFPDLFDPETKNGILNNLISTIPVFQEGKQTNIILEASVGSLTYEQHIYFVPGNKAIRSYNINVTERELSKLKSEFLSTAAHELRTPLTSIQGFSEILITRKDLDETKKREFLKLINEGAVYLAKLISDLLDVSRIEAEAGIELHKQNVSIVEIIKPLVDNFRVISRKHHFELICPAGLNSYRVLADKGKVQQVFTNIINNAIKYSPEGGKITVCGKRIEDKKIEISIKDEGIGIPKEEIYRIFEKFYRVDNEVTRESPGTGLGLYITKYILTQHGGDIRVESELGKGSNFIITLPVA